MQERRGCTLRHNVPGAVNVDPVALLREGVGGEADPLWLALAVQLVPIDLHTLDPQLQQSRHFPIGDPLIDHLLQIAVAAEHRQRLLVALYLSLKCVFDLLLASYIRLKLFRELYGRAHDDAEALVHRFAPGLERIGHCSEVECVLPRLDEVQQIAHLLV